MLVADVVRESLGGGAPRASALAERAKTEQATIVATEMTRCAVTRRSFPWSGPGYRPIRAVIEGNLNASGVLARSWKARAVALVGALAILVLLGEILGRLRVVR